MITDRIQRYLDRFADQVVNDSKELLRSEKGETALGKSIRSTVVRTSDGFDVKFYMNDYGTYLDEGVSGSKKQQSYTDYKGKKRISQYKYTTKGPPIDILSKWIKKKGIKPKGFGRGRDKDTGRYLSGLAIYISRKIRIGGIKGLSFFQEPLGIGLKKLDKEFLQEVTLDIKTYLTTYTK